MLKCIPFLLLVLCSYSAEAQQGFVKREGSHFTLNNKTYHYIGTNYWYGGLIGNDEKGKLRIKKELDFLKRNGIANLRIIAGAEGTGAINGTKRIVPALQATNGVFNADNLNGLDFLLSEMGKRNMKAVIYLSNNWDWSGGFLQYLNWNGMLPDSILKRKMSWDENRDYVSRFYSCQTCMAGYAKQADFIITRTNTITKNKYINDPTIMAWEIANEPRPMRPNAIPAYEKWISSVAATIKLLDKNHLLTTGTEGAIGTENIAVYKTIHADKNIDYLTIHIWPKNWGWFKDTAISKDLNTVIQKTKEFIDQHVQIANQLQKPLVIEEFGLPRNKQSFDPKSATQLRDRYYNEIFAILQASVKAESTLAGCNFWAFGGIARPKKSSIWWKEGDDYMGDPPPEEQGLNTVFDIDKSTWDVITSYSKKINNY